MLKIVGLFVWIAQVLGNTHLYPECETHNHMRLQEPGRKFENNQHSGLNDGILQAGWYRIDGQAGQRLLDITDIPQNTFKRNIKDFAPCGRKTDTETINTLVTFGIRTDSFFRTDFFYVLSESHPTEAPARISTTASAIRYRAVQRNAFGVEPFFPEPECETNNSETICYWKTELGSPTVEISVTNCVDFYVYFLQPTMIQGLTAPSRPNEFNPNPVKPLVYCTTKENISRVPHCSNYHNVTDLSRFWNAEERSVSDIQLSCQEQQFQNWTRFIYDNSTSAKIPHNCTPSKTSMTNPPCGSVYRGWFREEHPSHEDGRVTRTVCFSPHESCRCIATMIIDVINCGSFYIYKTPILKPLCYSRICLEKHEQRNTSTTSTEPMPITSQPTSTSVKVNATGNYTVATTNANVTITTTTKAPTKIAISSQKPQNLCENYATIVDDSRLFSNPSVENKCDFYFKTAVRFMSSNGKNLQLKENCSNEDVNNFRYYCGGAGLTYIEQLHPEKSDVPTRASLCVNTFFDGAPNLREDIFPRPDCKCNSRQNILVQNCSGFYVYQIAPISHFRLQCPARYCTEELNVPTSLSSTRSTTTTTTKTDSATQETVTAQYGVKGKLQIAQPMLNYHTVTASDLIDKNSMDYIFLMAICTDILNEGLRNVQGVKTRQITGLSIGSLIADYVVTLDQEVNAASLERSISDSLMTMPSVDVTLGERSFSGQINTTQSITDSDECALSTTCDVNAQCTNLPAIFSFQCKCNEGYEGNGFTCDKIAAKETVFENEWSNAQIGLVSAAFTAAFVVIIMLAYAVYHLYKTKKNTYATNNFKQDNYDQYLKSDRLENHNDTKLNMYVAVEPPAATHKSFQHETVIKKGHTTFDKK